MMEDGGSKSQSSETESLDVSMEMSVSVSVGGATGIVNSYDGDETEEDHLDEPVKKKRKRKGKSKQST